jgi:hypothetical protein
MRTVFAVIVAALAWATQAPAGQIPGLTGSAQDELAGNLRGLLLKHMPTPLYETARDWGRQTSGRRLQIRGRMRGIDADIVHDLKNDGLWQKLRVDAINPKESLILDLRNVVNKEPGKISFQVFAALDTHFEYHRQRWLSGVKLIDAKARARARVKITLDCEATARIENGLILPELVVQLSVTKADLRYDNLKFEHIAGIGGEAAETIGEIAHTAVTQWRPSVQRDLLEKANAAIIKAGENREVRLSLAKLFKTSKKDGK